MSTSDSSLKEVVLCDGLTHTAGYQSVSRETSEEVPAVGYESNFELLESEVSVGRPADRPGGQFIGCTW